MNAPLDLRMDKATFLRWVQSQEGRYELVGGRVVMQDTGSRDHGDIAAAFYRALWSRLPRQEWAVWMGNLSVEIGEETRVADVMVEPAGLPRKGNSTDQPVLLVEVLSPSSEDNDHYAKRDLYQTIPTLEVYIIASQDEPRLWVWQRSRDSARGFPDVDERLNALSQELELNFFGVTIPMAEIYGELFSSAPIRHE